MFHRLFSGLKNIEEPSDNPIWESFINAQNKKKEFPGTKRDLNFSGINSNCFSLNVKLNK